MKKAITLPTAPVTGALEEAFADVQQENAVKAAGEYIETVLGDRQG